MVKIVLAGAGAFLLLAAAGIVEQGQLLAARPVAHVKRDASGELPGPSHAPSARKSEWHITPHPMLPAPVSKASLNDVVKQTCAGCHSDLRKLGNMSLQGFDLETFGATSPALAEKMIGKLRTGMMPPPGRPRPAGDTLLRLTEALEKQMDARAIATPNVGIRPFQRLNRAEYESAIRELLALDIEADSWLPLDTKSANFDNISDVQTPSATVLESYLDAASSISRLAIGDPGDSPTTTNFKVSRLASQLEPEPGAPEGTRGGTSAMHVFPSDGEYIFSVRMYATPAGLLFGSTAPFNEKVEISVNGERIALIDLDRGMNEADPNGLELRTKPVRIRAGPSRVTAAFVKTFEGPVNDNIAPVGYSIADTQIGIQNGITVQAHVQFFAVTGPLNATGVSDTPSRRRIFSCRPTNALEARPCAERIINKLASAAYRRPVSAVDSKSLMTFYDTEAKTDGFELGVRAAVEAILASPLFIFRGEEIPITAKPGSTVQVSSIDMASRLSFFLWGGPPDSTLLAVARRGALSDTAGLAVQTKRMLADPRAEALSTRFAAQWLRLQDIDKVNPNYLLFPDYREQLALDMRKETELFFNSLVRENRSLLDLYSADYSYMNEALAKHYGIPNVAGTEFRRVKYTDPSRRGILGHASILTLTSHSNRTSPVLRGKWVMEVLMGSPPPPPPPDVPDLEKTGDVKDGRLLTTRERMEAHRANISCRSCHAFIDPIGLALDNFDVTGKWRIHENDMPLDTRGEYYDGTKISGSQDLRAVLLKRPVPLVRTFTQNLLSYAIGRRIEYFDGPTIRKIEYATRAKKYRLQDIVIGVVKSDAFRMRTVPPLRAEASVTSSPSR
jgi:hypothetical protein